MLIHYYYLPQCRHNPLRLRSPHFLEEQDLEEVSLKLELFLLLEKIQEELLLEMSKDQLESMMF
jgi:hypothetical protein